MHYTASVTIAMIVSRSRANVLRFGSSSASRYASISFPATSAILRCVPNGIKQPADGPGGGAGPRRSGFRQRPQQLKASGVATGSVLNHDTLGPARLH